MTPWSAATPHCLARSASTAMLKAGEGVLFGAGSMVYPGKKVGDWATIGLGSVVLRNVTGQRDDVREPCPQRIDAA
jgi:serine acetyltransferase